MTKDSTLLFAGGPLLPVRGCALGPSVLPWFLSLLSAGLLLCLSAGSRVFPVTPRTLC